MCNNFSHISVMPDEVIDGLAIKENAVLVDATAGGGGHSSLMLEKLSEKTGKLICIDRDPDAIAALTLKFGNKPNVTIVKNNFSNIKQILEELGISEIDGILMDIGVSSHQLDTAQRGFSFHTDAPLDMRMSQEGEDAKALLNRLDAKEISNIIFKYGEEKYARSIANAIVKARELKPLETTLELAEIIKESVPFSYRRDGHPARKTFQAIRVYLNSELEALKKGLDGAFDKLAQGGRLAVISFQSMEGVIIKSKFKEWCTGCTCPKDFPICVCGKQPKGRLITRKPLEPGGSEIQKNMRSRSAQLRVIEKINEKGGC